MVVRILQMTNADLGIIQGIRWHEISCDRQRFGSSLIRAFVLVANTTTGPDSKLHLTLHLTAIPCSKVAYLESELKIGSSVMFFNYHRLLPKTLSNEVFD